MDNSNTALSTNYLGQTSSGMMIKSYKANWHIVLYSEMDPFSHLNVKWVSESKKHRSASWIKITMIAELEYYTVGG